MSRLENTPSRVEVARMTTALVDIFCRSFPIPPAAITLDIDDTCDAVHGQPRSPERGLQATSDRRSIDTGPVAAR